MPDEKFAALADYADSDLFDERERAVLEYADCITMTQLDVCDELFDRLGKWFDHDAVIELTATIAWENASSKFNRALRVPSQGLMNISRNRMNQRRRVVEAAENADGK